MTEKEKMLSGNIYFSGGDELVKERELAKTICNRLNFDFTLDTKTKIEMIKKLIGSYGDNFLY